MSFGDLGDAIRLYLTFVLPFLSVAHGVSLLAGCFFAIGDGGVIRRLALLFSLFVAAVVMLLLTDYAIGLAAVGNVMLWLLARQNGFRLARLQVSEPPPRSAALGPGRWQFSLEFLLWLPIAVAYLFATASLLPPKTLTAELILGILVETVIILAVFVGITWVCLGARGQKRICVLLLLVFAWPMVALTWEWPPASFLWWWPPAANGTLVVTLWGMSAFTLVLLVCRRCGFRLVRDVVMGRRKRPA
jgi:hypothetical protein